MTLLVELQRPPRVENFKVQQQEKFCFEPSEYFSQVGPQQRTSPISHQWKPDSSLSNTTVSSSLSSFPCTDFPPFSVFPYWIPFPSHRPKNKKPDCCAASLSFIRSKPPGLLSPQLFSLIIHIKQPTTPSTFHFLHHNITRNLSLSSNTYTQRYI